MARKALSTPTSGLPFFLRYLMMNVHDYAPAQLQGTGAVNSKAEGFPYQIQPP